MNPTERPLLGSPDLQNHERRVVCGTLCSGRRMTQQEIQTPGSVTHRAHGPSETRTSMPSTGHLLLECVIHWRTLSERTAGTRGCCHSPGLSGFPTFPSFGNHPLAWRPTKQDPQGARRCPGQAASCLLVLFQWCLLCSSRQRLPSMIRTVPSGSMSSCSLLPSVLDPT